MEVLCALSLSTSFVEWWGACRCMRSQGLSLFQPGRKSSLSPGEPLHLGVHPSTVVTHWQLLQGCGVRPPEGWMWKQCGRFFLKCRPMCFLFSQPWWTVKLQSILVCVYKLSNDDGLKSFLLVMQIWSQWHSECFGKSRWTDFFFPLSNWN